MLPVALTVAGSDSGGGAGIQADLKTFHQFGVYGTSAIVAVTAQNTRGVQAVHPVPAAVVEAQLAALAEDLPPHALKSGMLATAELVGLLAAAITRYSWSGYVLDPVMVATSGDRLLSGDAEALVRSRLVPLADVVTPNLHEAGILAGFPVTGPETMARAGRALLDLGARAALVKGGHLPGDEVVDLLVSPDGLREIRHPRIATRSTHGTGCTLSAAITAGLARWRASGFGSGESGMDSSPPKPDLHRIVADAVDFVRRAIAAAPGLGSGAGPLSHLVTVRGEQ